MSTLITTNIKHPSSSSNNIVLNSDGSVTGVGGKILQVKQAFKQDVFTTTTSGTIDVTGLAVDLTPSSSSNKILVCATISGHSHNGHGGGPLLRRVLGGSTTILGQAAAASSRHRASMSGTLYTGDGSGSGQITFVSTTMFLDSPNTTSNVNYKISVHCTGAAVYINRTEGDGNSIDNSRTTSHITIMEIAA